jgi:hypothetical protein
MSPANFTRLVRFADTSGRVWYGEADGKDLTREGLVGQSVPIYDGESPWDEDFCRTSDTKEISQVRNADPSKQSESSQ